MIELNEDKILLRKIHPLTSIFIIITYLIALMTVNNVIYLSIIIFSIFFFAKTNDFLADLYPLIKYSFSFGIIIILFNFILNHNGNTVLIYLFNKPFTLESLFYGFVMALRLSGTIVTFAMANIIIDPDEGFSYFSKYLGKSALLMSMMFRLTPGLIELFKQIKEIEILRGNSFQGNIFYKSKSYSQVINILFITSLEESVEIAESMYSKGFGNNERTIYYTKTLYFYDYTLIIISIFIMLSLVTFVALGYNNYTFYPNFTNPFVGVNTIGLVTSILFFIYFLVIWWWKNAGYKNN